MTAFNAPRDDSSRKGLGSRGRRILARTYDATTALGRSTSAGVGSFCTGAWLCISLTRPALPKSISDIADSPMPETSSTRPRPYLSWVTRSPGSSTSSGRLPAPDAAWATAAVCRTGRPRSPARWARARIGAPPVDEMLRDLAQEPRLRVHHRLTPRRPDLRAADVEALAGARDADIRQPPFLG